MRLFLLALNLFAQPNIDDFFERFTKEWVRGSPQLATRTQMFTGEEQERLDRELAPVTREHADARLDLARKGLAELKRFDRSKLSASQRLSAAILEWQVETRIRGARFRDHNYVFEQMGGLQTDLPAFLSNTPIRRESDARNYLARLSQVAKRMDEGVAEARRREKKGIVPPKAILAVTVEQMKRLVAPEPAKSIWVTSLAERLDKLQGLSASARTDMVKTAEGTVSASINPAYQRAIALLESQQPKAAAEVGFWRLPGGAAAYAYELQRNTSTAIPAERIHQTGLDEVARIEKEIDRVLRQLGEVEGPREERLKRARAKRPGVLKDLAGSRERIIAEYGAIIRDAERRAGDLFDLRPKSAVDVRRTPEFREANAAASYTTPAPDGSRPGTFWVPLRGPNFSASRSLAYHEAVPGHHFQLALQNENRDLPKFRQYGVFGSTSGFNEGWGLYAERLAWEQGWYKDDPHGELGYLVSSDLFRARRLVVDTGLHTKRWTIEQGVEYGIRRSEVERYVTWPGQACAYKIGELKIVELREKAKRELGSAFSLKEFHNTVLRNGSMPLDVLAMVVDEYIRSKRK